MAQQTINTGNQPDDNSGDSLRAGMTKANANFTELYSVSTGAAAAAAAAQATADAAQPALGFTPENVANKSIDGTLALNSDTKYPSQKAVKTYADTKQTALGFTPENVTNKSIDGTLAANSDTLYPSQKAVKTYADGLVVGLLDDRGSFNASGNVFPSTGGSGTAGAVLKGDIWYISVGGTLGGVAVTIGDSVRALVNTPGQTAGNWSVLETNIGYVPENVANKTTDGTLAANSDTLYPSEKAVKTYVDAHAVAAPSELTNVDGFVFETFEDYTLGAISTLDKGLGFDNNGTATGATIVSRTNAGNGSSPTEKRLSLDVGEYVRKLPWGDAWNRIQILISFRVANTVGNFTGDGYLGICSGQSNTTSSATTANFVGLVFNKGVNGWTFSSGTLVDRTGFASGQTFITRRVNTNTSWGSTSGSDGRTYSVTEGYRSMLLLDIKRPVFANDAASVNYDGTVRSTNSTFVEFSHPKSTLRALLSTDPSATLGDLGSAVIGGGTEVAPSVAFDQSTGKLDTLNFYWPVSGHPFEIGAIGVRKVY